MAFLDDYPNLSLDNIASALKGDKNWSDVIDSSPQSQDSNQLPPDAVPATASSANSSVPDTALLDSDTLQKLSDTVASSMPTKSNDQQETVPEESEESDEEEEEPKEVTSAAKEAVTSAPIADNVINFGNTENSNADTLKRLLKQKEDVTLANQLGKAAELIGSGIASAGSHGFVAPTQRTGTELFNQNIALAGQPIQDFMTLTAQQKQDPNSPYAQGLRDFMKDTLHLNIKGGTPEQIMSVAPLAVKAYDAQQAVEARKDIAKQNAEARETIAHENALNRNASLEQRQEQHTEDKQNQALQQTKMLLESARGNPEVSQALKDRYAASKALALVNKDDPNKLSPPMVSLFQQELGKIATGGVPTMGELQALNPGTLREKFAGVVQKFTNEPSSANLGAFLNQYKSYLNDLNNNAQNVIKDKLGRVIDSSQKQLGEDNYNSLKKEYLSTPDVGQTQNLVTVRQISNGMTKTLDAATAAKYLKNPGYQVVQ
jgi:hypothetical protein